jgi:hypothetical protein
VGSCIHGNDRGGGCTTCYPSAPDVEQRFLIELAIQILSGKPRTRRLDLAATALVNKFYPPDKDES